MVTWTECSCCSCDSAMVQNLKREGYSNNALGFQALQDSVLPPSWYDRDKFLRGQEFFHTNFLSIFVSNLVGLVSILHMQGILSVLMKTGKSSSVCTAAKRYLSTLRHVYIWYSEDCFLPGSKANKSILLIRKFHNSAITSRKASKVQRSSEISKEFQPLPSTPGDYKDKEISLEDHKPVHTQIFPLNALLNHSRDSQCSKNDASHELQLVGSVGCTQQASQVDMVATLWAFCALPCIYWQELGVAKSSLPLMPDFLHFWRTVGYLMGVQDCFNICAPVEDSCTLKEDVPNSVNIAPRAHVHFHALQHQLLLPSISENKIHSRQMEDVLLKGVQRLLRVVEPEAFRCFTYQLLGLNSELQLPLSLYQRSVFRLQVYVLGTVLHLPLIGHLLRFALNGLLVFAITYADNAYAIAMVDYCLAALRLPLQLCSRIFSWLHGATKLLQQKLVFL